LPRFCGHFSAINPHFAPVAPYIRNWAALTCGRRKLLTTNSPMLADGSSAGPKLWNIFRGEFAWVGNRPLTKAQAALLSNDFERLWLNTSVGLVSLADVRGCIDSLNDESRAHASFYAVQHHWTFDLSILASALFDAVFGAGMEPVDEKEELPVSLQPSVVKEKA